MNWLYWATLTSRRSEWWWCAAITFHTWTQKLDDYIISAPGSKATLEMCSNVLSDWESLCAGLERGSHLQPISMKVLDNWWSPFAATSIILIVSVWGATAMHMCAISLALSLWTRLWRRIEYQCVLVEVVIYVGFSSAVTKPGKAAAGGAHAN